MVVWHLNQCLNMKLCYYIIDLRLGGFEYIWLISSAPYLWGGFLGETERGLVATGHPLSERWVRNEPLMCPAPSQPGVGQFIPSSLAAAVTAARAALCCSTVPPPSSTRILLRLAIGQPEALNIWFITELNLITKGIALI